MRIGITCGDVHGVGPQIILKALKGIKHRYQDCDFILYGHKHVFSFYDDLLGLSCSLDDYKFIEAFDYLDLSPGVPSKNAGKCAFHAVVKATEDLKTQKIDGLVTAPIDKATIHHEDFQFKGHTDFLKAAFELDEVLMVMACSEMKVALVTDHVPVREIADHLNSALIVKKALLFKQSLQKDFKVQHPKIALLGLNPHAGDQGRIGLEEQTIIKEALDALNVSEQFFYGPFGADGFFGTQQFKKYDGVLAMYHDQGLIPFKTLYFDQGVNFTAGLPQIRTSPDHGVAYDLAHTNQASEYSMISAIELAIELAKQRNA